VGLLVFCSLEVSEEVSELVASPVLSVLVVSDELSSPSVLVMVLDAPVSDDTSSLLPQAANEKTSVKTNKIANTFFIFTSPITW
jgi:hypothetical protein